MQQNPITAFVDRFGAELDKREEALLRSLERRGRLPTAAPDRCGYQLRPSRPARLTVSDASEQTIDVKASVGLEIYGFTVMCTDPNALRAFRLGWKFKGADDQDRTEFWEPGDDQTTYPLAEQVAVDKLVDLQELAHRPLAGRTLEKDDRLYFIVQDNNGQKPYDIEIVIWSWVQVAR